MQFKSFLSTVFLSLVCLGFSACEFKQKPVTSGSRLASTQNVDDVDWWAYFGMTVFEFQQRYDDAENKGWRPISISVYPINHQAHFAAIFEKRTDSVPWKATWDKTSDQYQAEADRWAQEHYRPVMVNAYSLHNIDYYSAIWEKRNGPPYASRHRQSRAEIDADVPYFSKRGYRLRYFSGYELNGGEQFAALWEKIGGPEQAIRYGLTSSEYQAEFDRLVSNGYQLAHVSGYTVNGQNRFAAIFEKGPGQVWQSSADMNAAAYQATFERMKDEGFRPASVVGYGTVDSEVFAAIWRKAK